MKLSQREWWTAILRMHGIQAKEAAHLMGISIHTYRTHVRHSLEMLRELSPDHSFQALARSLIEELTRALIEELVHALTAKQAELIKTRRHKKTE